MWRFFFLKLTKISLTYTKEKQNSQKLPNFGMEGTAKELSGGLPEALIKL
jgi:hypothetical protein